jgi:calcineurin-like phosphoesterase family protein
MTLAIPNAVVKALSYIKTPIRIGMIADLHHDIMHDGITRMNAFINEMKVQKPDAILQLGDFAYPNEANKQVIDLFNRAHPLPLHVIGNHDTDAGHTQQQCIGKWGMLGRYYAQYIAGVWLLVLDGNDKGSPDHKGGYPSYVGKEQRDWLIRQLSELEGPVIVCSHQPLAGAAAVDNAAEMQDILAAASDKVLLAINGHTHIDDLLRVQNVAYLHVNSASYYWVGGAYKHHSFSKEVHEDFPWISYTCPYRDALFAIMTIDPENLTIKIEGRQSEWVGQSPAGLGLDRESTLINGEESAPHIRDRKIERVQR